MPDLTGLVHYENKTEIAGGHAHIIKGKYIDPDGLAVHVAVKIIMVVDPFTGRVVSVDLPKYIKRGRRERKVWQRPKHENIIPLLGITTDYSSPLAPPNPVAMISPWMERGDLFKALNGNMAYSDRMHLANVLINDEGNACLTDFGLSFISPEFLDTSYWSRSVGGAIRWRAPELVPPISSVLDLEEYVPDLTSKCDIYSFGSLLLHAISGEWPYHTSQDHMVIIYLHHRTLPPRPQTLTDAQWELIVWCWGKGGHAVTRPTAEEVLVAISAL
ncbi:hypothetical protein HWV62_20059 [Athelia sp. TMB]|nr:hypothetical protein HWV62_20059 [Athelia sp. TMB]